MGTPWVSFDGKDCSGCKHLNERGYCEFTACIIPCTVRVTIPEVKPQTNADRIRAMSDEELAEWLDKLITHCNDGPCFNCFMQKACLTSMLDWLRKEINDGKEEKEEN